MAYMIWTTGACNLRCTYCYEGNTKPNKSMTREIADEVIDFIVRDCPPKKNLNNEELLINYHGGEPILNFVILRYITDRLEDAYRGKQCLLFSTTTNGTLFDKTVFDFLVEHQFSLTLSLDGKEGTHDQNRKFADGRGSYAVALAAAKELLARGQKPRIRMTITPRTVGSLCENVAFLLQEGFDCIAPVIDSYCEWDEQSFDRMKEEIAKIRKLHLEYPSSSIGVLEKLHYCGVCKGGLGSKHFYYDGSIYPCAAACGHKEFEIGNAKKGIDERRLQEIFAYSERENPLCVGCDMERYCDGARCKILNRIITGDYLTPPVVQCAYTNLIYESNGILLEQW